MQIIVINYTNASGTGDAPISSIEIPADADVEVLFQMMQFEIQINIGEMEILHDEQPILLNAQMLGVKLMQLGILDGSALSVRRRALPPLPSSSITSSAGETNFNGQDVSIYTLPANLKVDEYIQLCKDHPRLLGQFKSMDPDLAALIEAGDKPKLQSFLMKRIMAGETKKYTEVQDMKKFEANPDDPELQKKFEEKIRLENIDEQYISCRENYPEAFGSVIMLYVDIEINNKPIKAFVDSGAQMTIMSKRMAQECGLDHLIDERFQGEARGVGTAKILGKVHIAQMKFGTSIFPISLTILESGDVDFLLGLDMLKRYRCHIDLAKNCLRIEGFGGSEEVTFLSENSLPENAKGTRQADLSPRSPGDGAAEKATPMDTDTASK